MSQKIKYIDIPLPEEVFDVNGAFIIRRKRIPTYRVDALFQIRQSDDPDKTQKLYAAVAEFFPRWQGVVDCETGETLPNPEDDPTVFSRLDVTEQWPWIMNTGLTYSPNSRKGQR